MSERIAAIGNQVRQAFSKVWEAWKNLEIKWKRIILIALIGLIVLALGLIVFLNVRASRFVVLYEGIPNEEAVRGLAALQTAGIQGRINNQGDLEVPANRENEAMGQLAIEGIPSSTLDYSIMEQAGGLTTTDFEKRQYAINQTQNRLQDIIRTYAGVENAYVTLNIGETSNRVWNAGITTNTASVKVDLVEGSVLTAGQVAGIRHLVGPSAGIDPNEVAVIDSNGTILAASGEEYNMEQTATSVFLERYGFEAEVEERLHNKTANILSLPYPDADDYRISVTAHLDWDAMITESMQYEPLEGTDHGVMNHEDLEAVMGTGQYAEGVVGETDNTDVPVYADLDGDGELDLVDYYQNRDYLVSYVKSQIEKDGATLADSSIAVMVRGNLPNETRQALRESIAAATNISIDSVSVQGFLEAEDSQEQEANTIFGLPALFVYIAAAVLLVMIILLVVIMILRDRAKKRRLAEELAEAEAEEAEALRIQQEIEERKQQLKDAAVGDEKENAITEEVREFARNNPEITASLLRNWLKEGEA